MSTTKRTPNFTYQDKKKLLMLIEKKYAAILENKNTNKVTIKEKDETWNAIEAEFNSTGTIIYYRNKDSLRRLYENIKKDLRKKMANEKANIIKTGGGSSYITIYDELEEILIRIINEKTLVGLKSKWDCDADDSPIPVKQNKNSSYVVYLDESTYNNVSNQFVPFMDINIS